EGLEGFHGSKMTAALHEAGHLIVEKLEGRTAEWVKIWRGQSGVGWAGYTKGDGPLYRIGLDAPPENNLRAARQVMPGYIAERVFNVSHAGSSIDERAMSIVLCMWSKGAKILTQDNKDEVLRVWRETERTVGEMLKRNEGHARAIARALIAAVPSKMGQTLKGRRLQALLKDIA